MKLELQKGSRSNILAVAIMFVAAVFVARLFYLQVIRHEHYVSLADQEQLKQWVVPAKRGMIYALDGSNPVPLVMNETVYTVFADPQIITDQQEVTQAIREIAGGNTRPNFEELLARKETRYQIIATKLTRTQADKLKERRLVGIGFHEESQRVYPENGLAGQVLGFVNAEGKGNYGVEGALDDRLQGKDGLLRAVTDIRDVPLTIGDRNINQPAEDGDDIVLSIDRNVQSYAEQALREGLKKTGAKNGSVLVMDPQTGRVMAMANVPTYNPSEFTKVQDAALFNNAIISAPYEPASVIKTFTMATGIEKGVITPRSTYYNHDSIKVYDRTIFNAYRGMIGTLTMQDVLNNSLNTGTVTIAQRLGDGENVTQQARDTMYTYFHDRFRLGQLTGIELAGEAAGTVVPPDQVEGNAVRYSNMTFGQGLNVTMLQVASGFSAMINGGTYYKPTVLAGVRENDGSMKNTDPEVVERGVVSAETSATMRQMLQKTREYLRDPGSDKEGYEIGGKTGTAETIENGVYIKSQTVGTYLGYGGDDRPRYVIMVQVSSPGMYVEGGRHAGPIFTDISNWMIDYLTLQPKG